MKIKAISLKNFRNYRKIDINFNSNINLFLGKNGQGKTNLLEAIWICINGKSYRTNTTKNLINFSKNNAEIITRFSNQDSNNEIRISIKDNKKEIFLNDKKIKNRAELKKIISTVILDKEFKDNIEKSYKPRRIALDSIISNFSLGFHKKLNMFNKELKRKSEVLNSNSNEEILDFVDKRLIELSNKISIERKLWLSRITEMSEKILKRINPSFTLDLVYKSNCLEIKSLSEKFKINRYKEQVSRRPLTGSHKDDISFLLNNSDTFEFGSEGEKKSVCMAFKISEILFLKKINNTFPVILVDEIGSEFDQERFKFFFDFIIRLQAQTFITANNKKIFEENKEQKFDIFSINNGDCKKIS